MFPAMSDLNIENTNIKTASGVSLDDNQKTLVGSVLDVSLFINPGICHRGINANFSSLLADPR